MSGRRTTLLVLVVAALVALLAHLRDPPWLAGMASGMHPWTVAEDGARVRWIGGRASFFVPSEARVVRVPVRTTFDDPADWPITVTVTLDDRRVDRLSLKDAGWRMIEIRMPPPGSRRHRRIGMHLDRTRVEGRGALLGEVEIRH